MTKGIPETNRSNYGITYLSKASDISFYKDDTQDHTSGITAIRDREALYAEADNKRPKNPTAGIGHRPHPKLYGQARESFGDGRSRIPNQTGNKFSDKPEPKATADTKTRTYFTNPNFTTQRIRSLPTGRAQPIAGKKPSEGSKPDHKFADISAIRTGTHTPSDSLGGEVHPSHTKIEAEAKIPQGKSMQERTGGGVGGAHNVGKQPHKQVGNAPKGTKSEKEKVGGRNVKVGVGSTAHSKFQKRGGVGADEPTTNSKSEAKQAAEHKARKARYARSEITRLEREEAISKLGRGIKRKAQDVYVKASLLKLDLMNKKDSWDKNEKINDKKSTDTSSWKVTGTGMTSDNPEVKDPEISHQNIDDEFGAGKKDPAKKIPSARVGEHPMEGKGSFIPSALGHKHNDTKYTTSNITGNKDIKGKNRKYNLTPAMMTESYESAKLHKAADEIIFKAISLKLDLTTLK